MDIRMPVLDGLAATRQLTASGPDAPKVVILTTFDLDDYVYEALRAGASGFLLKDAPRADLIAAVRVAAAGDALLAPSVTRRLIEAFAARPAETLPAPSRLASLTPRERDILLLLARGRSNAEIAARPGGQRGDGQDARRPPARQARPARPRPGGHPRLRNRRGHPRPPRLARPVSASVRRRIDTGEGGGTGGKALRANRAAAYVAYFVLTGIDFPQCRVNRRQVRARLVDQRRDVLPLERDGGAFRVMLVVAPGRAFAGAGDDRARTPVPVRRCGRGPDRDRYSAATWRHSGSVTCIGYHIGKQDPAIASRIRVGPSRQLRR